MASEPESLFDEIEDDGLEAFESLDDAAEMDPVDEIGQTSAEAAEPVQPAPAAAAATEPRRRRFGSSLSIYDAMLIASAACILIACVLLVIELSSFGGPFFQWRTSEALVEPITPPS